MSRSGLGISLFRFVQVPSKVPHGLMQIDGGGLFSGLGLVLGDFSSQLLVQGSGLCFLEACAWDARDFRGPPGLEKNS
jgi:hypothetical protein